jgi:N-acyl-D-aspartate/D-glutamate deacylase
MLDSLLRGGLLVDGSGSRPRRADVGIRDGIIARIGRIDEPARQTIDARDLVVAPGFIDPHTHYDAQLWWDATAAPSNLHGVTTIIGGNCGFTLAPVRPRDADYTRRMMARVEGMSLAALESGIDWRWESFSEFLEGLDGRVGVNAGFLAGHCAIRQYVMGDAALSDRATPAQVAAMSDELRRALEAGALGLSTTRNPAHLDGEGLPVASRVATIDELVALCRVVGEQPGTTLEGIVEGSNFLFSVEEIELLVSMSAAANRPVNWNVLTLDSAAPERLTHQLEPSRRAPAAGGRVVALTMPTLVPMNMSLRNYCALFSLPGWSTVLGLPLTERMIKLDDPATRAWMLERAHSPEAGVYSRLTDFDHYVVGDTISPDNAGLSGRVVADVAAERGRSPFDTFIDIAMADELGTVWWPTPTDNDDASWQMRREAWLSGHTLLGGSDAGAHLDRMCGAPYTTTFLGDTLRGRQLVPLERAVQMLTDAPARLFGLRRRGRLTEGWHADVTVFDPATVDALPARLVHDLPGRGVRLDAASIGVHRVLVNGVEVVRDGSATGRTPGVVLRSGRDTETVSAR